MNYIKKFESFNQPEGTGKDSFWEKKIDNKIIRITLDDVLSYLDNIIEVDTNEIEHLLIDVDRDPERVEASDLRYPIILVSSNGEYISILDGQHRVVKAIRDSVNVKARVLDLDHAPDEFVSVFKK